ncbi:hypothetical protein E3J48_08255 [Candidatus Aerophobetes bacterium]|uniref:Uncharacterized protein n=1 Tax=Aerophobetes bacterium TaxID=2030807 RepID=A0A523VWH1_UNCAE|nr:MAG: hypothetical protein E3J48_08255 [Candidatus Aerophobetes bacterium]
MSTVDEKLVATMLLHFVETSGPEAEEEPTQLEVELAQSPAERILNFLEAHWPWVAGGLGVIVLILVLKK